MKRNGIRAHIPKSPYVQYGTEFVKKIVRFIPATYLDTTQLHSSSALALIMLPLMRSLSARNGAMPWRKEQRRDINQPDSEYGSHSLVHSWTIQVTESSYFTHLCIPRISIRLREGRTKDGLPRSDFCEVRADPMCVKVIVPAFSEKYDAVYNAVSKFRLEPDF